MQPMVHLALKTTFRPLNSGLYGG